MPETREIRKWNEIGQKSPGAKYIWGRCIDCGKARWVRVLKGKAISIRCSPCENKRRKPRGRNMIILKCLWCGKDFEAYHCRLKKGKRFCSRACHEAYRDRRQECVCPWCGKKFLRQLANVKQGSTFCSKTCSTIYRMKYGGFAMKPTGIEKLVMSICEEYQLPFKYVGDGQVWLGKRNPDFINIDGAKQVIEVLGAYWHPIFDGAGKIEHYKQYGFDCLVIWEEEFKNMTKVANKMKRFALKEEIKRLIESNGTEG